MNDNIQVLTNEEEDYLKELINIGFGLSASIIGDMLNSRANLVIPKISIHPISKLQEVVKQKMNGYEYMLIRQLFQSMMEGDLYFMLKKEDSHKVASLLFRGREFSDDDVKSTILEITNILTSACIGQIAEMNKKRVNFLPPELFSQEKLIDVNPAEFKEFTQFMLVETCLDLEDDGITGQILIFMGEGVLMAILEKAPKRA